MLAHTFATYSASKGEHSTNFQPKLKHALFVDDLDRNKLLPIYLSKQTNNSEFFVNNACNVIYH